MMSYGLTFCLTIFLVFCKKFKQVIGNDGIRIPLVTVFSHTIYGRWLIWFHSCNVTWANKHFCQSFLGPHHTWQNNCFLTHNMAIFLRLFLANHGKLEWGKKYKKCKWNKFFLITFQWQIIFFDSAFFCP
jgi:hypothetical protein